MNLPQDHDPRLLQSGGAAAALIENKERIADAFVERVRQSLEPGEKYSFPITIDTLPEFLTSVAIALSPTYAAPMQTSVAVEHGVIRARITDYSLTDLVKEYQILREILAETLDALAAPPSPAEWRIVHRCVDVAIADATAAFVGVHEAVREQFTATLTHDLRGPLEAVQNYLELLRRAGDRPEQRNHFVARAMQNVRRIGRMIEDVLDASRVRAGERIGIQPGPCDLAAELRELVDEFTSQHGERFVLESQPALHACCDGERLRQALQNLLTNAIKYGSAEGPITLRVVAEASRLQISVHNFGDPIAPETREQLFQAYKRSVAAQQSGRRGWGLGLVLVHAIAEAHGGTVLLESGADLGTTFTLDILQDTRDLDVDASGQKAR